MPTVAETATAAMMAGADGMVGQFKSALTVKETPRPRPMPAIPPARQKQHRFNQELPKDIARPRSNSHPQPDLARTLGHRDQHDVHDSHAADNKRNKSDAQKQIRHHRRARRQRLRKL